MSKCLIASASAGKVAVVTGASSGLGAAFSLGLGQAGADVVLGARRAGRLAATRDAVWNWAGRRSRWPPTWRRRAIARLWSTRRWPSSAGSTSWSTTRASRPPPRPPARPPRPSPGDRHQPQRLLLDGPGVRPGDATGQHHHQHRQRAGADHRRPAAGGLHRQQGRAARPDPRPGPAMGRAAKVSGSTRWPRASSRRR